MSDSPQPDDIPTSDIPTADIVYVSPVTTATGAASSAGPDADGIVMAEVVRPGGINRKYLTPADLRRLTHTSFNSRRAIESLYAGKHKTTQHGQSIEFHDYRQYLPGDEIGHVDWKVYARSDKLFIKLFEHQSDLTVHLLVDASKSMSFSGYLPLGDTKYDLACRLAAAIGFLIAKQSDRFSFGLAQNGLRHFQPPRSTMNHLMEVLDQMETVKLSGTTDLGKSVSDLIPNSRRRDLLCVFSDLIEENETLLDQLNIWSERGGEAIVFQTLHDDEIELPKVHSGMFYDSETGSRMRVDVGSLRQDYQRHFQAFLDKWSQNCVRRGIDYNVVKVSDSYTKILERYFGRRKNRFG